jgi:outer membrane protein OmpA-like peptidoglycan-associated protein
MNKYGLLLATAATLAVGSTASAQSSNGGGNQPSYDCALYNECAVSTATEEVERGNTRGWNLSRTVPTSAKKPVVAKVKPATVAVATPRVAGPMPVAAARSKPRLAPVAAPVQQDMARVRLAQGVTFVSGSARLTPAAMQNVDRLAAAMLRPDKLTQRFRIEGNTDSVGERAMNVDLSKRRASAVADYLVSKGVAPARLEMMGYGFDNALPGLPGSSAANRRVEAKPIS